MQPFAGHGIGVSVSAGAKKPGDRVDASIHVIEPAKARDILTRTIRCKLTERKPDGAYLRTVAESTERLTDLNSYSSFSTAPGEGGSLVLPDRRNFERGAGGGYRAGRARSAGSGSQSRAYA